MLDQHALADTAAADDDDRLPPGDVQVHAVEHDLRAERLLDALDMDELRVGRRRRTGTCVMLRATIWRPWSDATHLRQTQRTSLRMKRLLSQ